MLARGMGDAVRDGEVRDGDPERTIDAAEAPVEDRAALAPRRLAAAEADYPELATVERRHYVVAREIAKGGMGRVLEARDLRIGRQVAIKELLPRHRDAARRFEREARITARLQHPAIIHVYEAGVWPGGEPFYAMPMIAGESLAKAIAKRPTLNERLGLVPNVIAVADALAYAHSQQIIHRDLKPSNVLVGEFGETVVIDWGVAKDLRVHCDPQESIQLSRRPLGEETASGGVVTVSGGVVGTAAYMPPEQADGEPVDQRADVYALGALLYHVLVGTPPYAGSRVEDVLAQVMAGPPIPVADREPGAPPDLVAIVGKAMARDPAARYASAGELAQDLRNFQTGQLVAAHRYTAGQLAWRWLRRHRVAVAIVAATAIALATVGGFSLQRIVAARDAAEAERAVAETARATAEARRAALLEERGRTELLAGRAGPALAYLVGAVRGGATGRALGFLVADAERAFSSRTAKLPSGSGPVVIAVSADGTLVATASDRVLLWHGGAPPPRELDGGHGRIRALGFDPSGAHLAAGGDDGVVRIWPTSGGAAVELRGPEPLGTITGLDFSADGTRLVASGASGVAYVWSLASGELVASRCDLLGPAVSPRFSPDGARVAMASDDVACVWDASDGNVLVPLRGHTRAIDSVRWSPDGTRVVTASEDGYARVWDQQEKSVVAPLQHAGAVRVAEVSPDGAYVLTGGADGIARLWALPRHAAVEQDARQVAVLDHGSAITAAAFSADGTRIATAGDRLVKLWDAQTHQQLAAFEHPDAVSAVAFAGTSRLVTAVSGVAYVWDITHGVAREARELDNPVSAIALAGGVLAAGTSDDLVTVWRPGEPSRQLRGHTGRVLAVALSADGATLVSGGEDRQPIVWDVATGKERCRLREHVGAIRAIAIAGRLVATTAGRGAWLSSLDDCHAVRVLGSGAITSLAFAGGGAWLIGGTSDGSVIAWDVATGAARARPGVTTGGVTALAARGGALLVAGNDVRIYPFANGQFGASRALEVPSGTVTAVAWLDDARVVTASADGSASVWDAARGKLLGTRAAPGAATTSLAADAAGDTLWSGGEDGVVRAWDVHVATAPAAELERFLDERVTWRLGPDDVVMRKGDLDDQRGSDRE